MPLDSISDGATPLDVDDQDAYLSRRSLVEFRRRLIDRDPDMKVVRMIFDQISKSAIQKLGLSTKDQRVDSTHIVSNICVRGRLDLFMRTIKHFLNSLNEAEFTRIPNNIQKWHQREPDGWSGLQSAEKRKVKLEQLVKYLNKLIAIFKTDHQISAREEYQLLVRLFEEQCEVTKHGQIKIKKKTEGETLQSPYDPDAVTV